MPFEREEAGTSTRMKILFLCRSLDVGGAERQIVELAKGLRQRGHEVSVAVLYGGGPLEADLEAADVPRHDLRKSGRWDIAGFAARLVRLLRAERPDVLHSYLTLPNLLAAASRPLLRRTAVVWGVRASSMNLEHYDWLFRLVERLAVFLSRRVDRIIVNSQAGFAHHLRIGYPAPAMRVVENGIDTGRFFPDRARGVELRRHWGVPGSEILIGLVGRLDPMKGHQTFLEAAASIAAHRPELRFVCVGNGDAAFLAHLRRIADRSGLGGRVVWQNAVPDPMPAYNALDVLCSASDGEGFSNVIAEAMACGVPCVATDVGDSARIVGRPEYVAEPGNPRSLEQALITLLDDLKAQRVDRAALRQRIVESYSIERLACRTENLLSEAVAQRLGRNAR